MIVYLKTQEEIEGFVYAGRIAGRIMKELIESITVGSTTNQINEKAIELCDLYGVKPAFLGYEGFPAAICASVNDALVHGIPDDSPLQQRDLVSIDLGVDYEGYIGDTAVTVSPLFQYHDFSEAYEHQLEMLIVGRHCLDAGIAAARAGNKLSDIAKAINESRYSYSLPDNYGGHGIDRYKLHCAPFVANNPEHIEFDITLRPNMVIAIEPMLIDGSSTTHVAEDKWTVMADGPAVHFEHTVLITDGNPVVLTDRG